MTQSKQAAIPAELNDHFGPDFSARIEFRVSAELVDAFADLTGDRSSLHVDDRFADESMYRRRVAHGMLPVSMLACCPALAMHGWASRLLSIDGHFAGPVYVGDSVVLTISREPERDSGSAFRFAYGISKSATEEPVTRGHFALEFSREEPSPIDRSPEPAKASASLLVGSLDELALSIEELSKGMTDGLGFVVSGRAIESFLALTERAAPDLGPPAARDAAGKFDLTGLLAVVEFSTLVGMRLPGSTATFVNFSAGLDERIVGDREYRMQGTIAHVSRGAGLLRTNVAVTSAAGDAAMSGAITTLVNPVSEGRQSLAELRGSAADLGLSDKVVLVTGATGGIGETTAKLFSLLGCCVVVNYRTAERDALRIVREIESEGSRALAVRADVTDPADVSTMIDRVVQEFGCVDVLVNNAVRNFEAIAYDDLTWEEVQLDLDVTLKGAFLCAKAVTPGMSARGGGKIINVSSVYASDPPRDQLKYVVSKAAVEGLTRGLAAELADRNIQVNAVVPSFVDTQVASRMHAGIRRKKAQAAVMRRNAKPEEVAQAVVFLASAFSSYTTGQRLLVTGGGPPYL